MALMNNEHIKKSVASYNDYFKEGKKSIGVKSSSTDHKLEVAITKLKP